MDAYDVYNVVINTLKNTENKIGEKIDLIRYYDNSFLINCFNISKKNGEIQQELKCAKRIEKEYNWINTIAKFLEQYILTKKVRITNMKMKTDKIIIGLKKEVNNIELSSIIEIHDANTDDLKNIFDFVSFIDIMNKNKISPSKKNDFSKEEIISSLETCDKKVLIKLILEKYDKEELHDLLMAIKNKQLKK